MFEVRSKSRKPLLAGAREGPTALERSGAKMGAAIMMWGEDEDHRAQASSFLRDRSMAVAILCGYSPKGWLSGGLCDAPRSRRVR
jgi:hypothetical protein